MKTIEKLMIKASEKGFAKSGTWEVEQVQGEFIRLKHYGTCILKVDYTTTPATIEENRTSQSDSRAINFMLKQLKLFKYPNSLKGFTEWSINNPTTFDSDNIEGTLKRTKEGKLYVESMKRKSFIDDSIAEIVTKYEFEDGSFNYVTSTTKWL